VEYNWTERMISEEDDDNISPEDSVVDSDDEFEDQGSSDGEDVLQKQQEESDSDEEELLHHLESSARSWSVGRERTEQIKESLNTESGKLEQQLHVDDLSSDDEEAGGNTIGRVPLHWYDAYDHIGYSITGEKVMKEKRGDTIDNAIANKDDPSSSRTVYDMYNGKYVTLSERDIEVIRRLQAGAFAHPEHNDTPDYIDYYSSIIEDMPVSAAPESRRQFVSSKWEMMKVMKIVKAMKEGRYVFQNDKRMNKVAKPALFMIWNDTEDEVLADSKRHRYHLPAPKAPLPGHSESYNPPQEYLLTPEELKKWEEMDPSERERNFVPKKYSCLRHVPGYENAIKERFERCLDLYLCPRKLKRRLNIDPETLVPRLPKPRELRPFPNMLSLQFLGHTKRIRSLAVSPDGQYLVSGSDDGTVRLWEVDNSLCRETWVLDEPVVSVSWNPNSSHHLIAVAVGTRLVLISTGTGDDDSNEILDSFLSVTELQISSATTDETSKKDDSEILHSDSEEDQPAAKETDTGLKWTCIGSPATERIISKKKPLDESVGHKVGPRVYIDFGSAVSCIAWHYRGDYIAVVCPTAGSNAVSIHQVIYLYGIMD
jgi:ribosome biogenesis protein ERB1